MPGFLHREYENVHQERQESFSRNHTFMLFQGPVAYAETLWRKSLTLSSVLTIHTACRKDEFETVRHKQEEHEFGFPSIMKTSVLR